MPDITEAKIVFEFEIDDTPIRKINEVMDDFRENQLRSNKELKKSLEQMNKKGIKNTITGFAKVRKALRDDLKQQRNAHKQHGEWLKGINDKYKTNVQTVNKKLTSDVKSNAKKQSNAVKGAYKEIEVSVTKALSGISKQFSKQTRNVSKEAKKLGKDFSKISGMFKLDIDTAELDKPVDDMRTMIATLKSVGGKEFADFNASITRGYRLMSSNNADEIKQGQQIIENTLKRNYTNQLKMLRENTGKQMNLILKNKKEQIQAHKDTLARLLSSDRLSDKKRLEIEKSFQDKIKAIKTGANRRVIQLNQQRNNTEVRMAQQHSRRMAGVQRTGRRQQQIMPGRRVIGRLQNTPIFGEMAQAAQGLTARLGPLGSALGKLGPIGIAVAGVLGGTALLFAKSAKAAGLYHDSLARIGTLLDDVQMEQLPAAMDKVRATALSTGKSIDNLATTFYNVISAAPILGSNLNAVSSIVDKAARTATALGAETDEIALAMTNMGNAAGLSLENVKNQDLLLDMLANTMKQGVIPSASVLASQIAKNAPLFAALNANVEDTVHILGAATALFTASGVSMEETQTQMKAFATELIDVNKQAKLLEAGIEGINPEGQVEDWRKLTDSIVANMDEVMKIFTSSEAKNAVRILAKEGGEAFKDLITSMENAGGTSDAMFERMANTSKMASDRLGVAWNDLMISMGSGSESMVTGFKNGLTSMINGINSLFETSQQQMTQAFSKGQEYIGLSTDLKGVSAILEDALTKGDKDTTSKAFAIIEEKARQIEKVLPGMAFEINAILEGSGDAASKMEQLGIALENVERVVALLGKIETGEAIKIGKEQIADIADEYDSIVANQEKQKERQQRVLDIIILTEKALSGQLLTEKERALVARESIGIIKLQEGFEKSLTKESMISKILHEDLNRLKEELSENAGKILETDLEINKANLGTVKLTQQITKGLMDTARVDGIILTKEQLRLKLETQMGAVGKNSVKIQEQIADEIDRQVDLAEESYQVRLAEHLTATELQGITEQLTTENLRNLDVSNQKVASVLREKNATMKILGAKIGILIADKALLSAQGLLTKEKERQLELELQILIARTQGLEVTTAAMKAAPMGPFLPEKTTTEDIKITDDTRKKPPGGRTKESARREQKFTADQMAKAITERVNAEKAAWELAQKERKAIIQSENDQKKKELKRHAEFMAQSKKKFEAELKLIGERLEAERQFNKQLRDIAKRFQQQAVEIAERGTSEAKAVLKRVTPDESMAMRLKELEELEEMKTKSLKERIKTELDGKKEIIILTEKERDIALKKPIKELKERKIKAEDIGFGADPGIAERLLEINRQEMDSLVKTIDQITSDAENKIIKLKKELEQIEISAGLTIDVSDFEKKIALSTKSIEQAMGLYNEFLTLAKTPVSGETTEFISAQFDVVAEKFKKARDFFTKTKAGKNFLSVVLEDIDKRKAVLDRLLDKTKENSFINLIMNPPPGMSADEILVNFNDQIKKLEPALKDTFPLFLQNVKDIAESGEDATVVMEKLNQTFGGETLEKLNKQTIEQSKIVDELFEKYNKLKKPLSQINATNFLKDMKDIVELDMSDLARSTQAIIDAVTGGKTVGKRGAAFMEEYRKLIMESNKQVVSLNKEVDELVNNSEKENKELSLTEILTKSIKDENEATNKIAFKTTEIAKENKKAYTDRVIQVRLELEARKKLLESEIELGILKGKAKGDAEIEIAMIKNELASEFLQLTEETYKIIRDGKEVELSRFVITEESYDKAKDKVALMLEDLEINKESKKIWEETLDLSGSLINKLKQIKEQKEAIIAADKTVFVKDKKGKETKEVDVEATNKAQIDAQKKLNKLDKESLDYKVAIMKQVESAVDLTFEIATSFDEIQNMFRKGEGGAAVERIGDLTKKVGEALMNSSIPQLQVIGAVLLGIGIITKVVGKIISLFVKPEETRTQQAEKYVAAQERLLAIYDAQKEKLDGLAKMGDRSVDQAYERLAIEQQLLQTKLAQAGQGSKTYEQVSNELEQLQIDIAAVIEATVGFNAALEKGSTSDQYHDELRKLFGEGEVFAGRWDEIFEDLGSDLEGFITDADFEDAIAVINAELDEMGIDATGLKDLKASMELLKKLASQVRQEFEDLIDLKVDLIVDLGLTNEDIVKAAESVTDMYRDVLNEKLKEIAPQIDWASLSPDKLKEEFLAIDTSQFSPQDLDAFNQWLDSLDNIGESLDGLANSQMALNTARTKIDPSDPDFMSEADANAANLVILQEQLAVAEALEFSDEIILGLKGEIYAIEQDILDLGKEGNDVLSEKIRLMHEERQAAIARVREGTATAADIALIGNLEQRIIEEMEKAGASPEELEATSQAFAASSREEGSDFIPQNELAYLHEGEAVLTKADNKLLAKLQSNVNASNIYMKGILDTYTASNLKKQSMPMDYFGDSAKMGDTIINFNINISDNVDEPEELAEILYGKFTELHKKDHMNSGSWNGRA